jgi:hypothetical protein
MTHRIVLVAFVHLLMAAQTQAQTTGPPWPAQVSVPSTHRIQFTSSINGENYTLSIHVPLTPPPPAGYPVIYVLDGDFLFGMASDISLAIGNPALTPVVVGVGHGLLENMDLVARYAKRKPGDTGLLRVKATPACRPLH